MHLTDKTVQDYCNACRLRNERQGLSPHCEGCEYEQPDLSVYAHFFVDLYLLVYSARDGFGTLQYSALADVIDAFGLDSEEKRMMYEIVRDVEAEIRKRMEDEK